MRARSVSRELPVDPYRDLRWGFPCCLWSPMRTCRRHYPGRFNGACSLVCLHCQRPSLCNSKVGSCNCFFEACSAFTHVMACTLAESPSDPLHRKLRQLRCLRWRFDCYRVERTSPGRELHPLKSSAFHGALLHQLCDKFGLHAYAREVGNSERQTLTTLGLISQCKPSPPHPWRRSHNQLVCAR
jgi:hypothetical protein